MLIDYVAIEAALKEMKPQTKLFELVKAEMKRRGYWKTKARGKAFDKGYDPRRASK